MTIPEIIREAMAEIDLTQFQLAEKLGYSNNGAVSQILNNKNGKRVPIDAIDLWIHSLKLSPVRAAQFRQLVELSHAAPGVASRVESLERQVDALKRIAHSLFARIFPMAPDAEIDALMAASSDPEALRHAWIALSEKYRPSRKD